MTTGALRRGARHPSLVPAATLALLEAGEESANHMEQIAMDMGNLLVSQFPALSHRAREVRNAGLVARMRAGGRVLLDELGLDGVRSGYAWESDTTRGWAAMAIGLARDVGLDERVALMRPFADDGHFAVREWAWLSLRPHVAADVAGAVATLAILTSEPSERLRRFASEATRPRGVWSVHLPELKARPSLGLSILEALRADPARYVQDSVANWLNDAGKTQPVWVRQTCGRWAMESCDAATVRICRRAQRSLGGD